MKLETSGHWVGRLSQVLSRVENFLPTYIHLFVKYKVYCPMLRPIVIYACETWILKEAEKHELLQVGGHRDLPFKIDRNHESLRIHIKK